MNATVIRFEESHLDRIQMREPERTRTKRNPAFRVNCRASEKIGGAYTLIVDEGVVLCAGILPTLPGVGSAWMVTSDLVKKYPKATYQMTRALVDAIMADWGLHRVSATVDKDNEVAKNWLRHLGFEEEGLMRAFGMDREDHYLFARVI